MDCRLLLIDDEDALREEIEDFLSFEGVQLSSVASAVEALVLLDRWSPGHYQVILTDVKMPGVDGLSFANRLLAANAEDVALEVIVMTGHDYPGTSQEAVTKGIFAVITKPFKLVDLMATVKSAFESARARRA